MQIDELKQKLPLPQLMEQLGYSEFAKRSVCSPFREDKNPSWGIYKDAKGWHFKDFATGEGGDELDFLAIHNKCDPKQALKLYQEYAGNTPIEATVSIGELPPQDEWTQAVEALVAKDNWLLKLGQKRGYSKTLLAGLIENGLIGLHDKSIAFPIYNQGGVFQGMHLRGANGWRITGGGTEPWLIGQHDAKNVHVFESQWDAFAMMDTLGYGNGAWQSERDCVLISRGASNTKKLADYIGEGQKVYIWPQNDEPGEKWVQKVAELAPGEVLKVNVPAAYKDAQEWLKGEGKEKLKTGLAFARPLEVTKEPDKEQPAAFKISNYEELAAETMAVPPLVIDGVLYKGGKMILGGTSKGRKTWSLMDLSAAIATGGDFWGMQTNLGEVLYVNFELQPFLFRQRMEAIRKARKAEDLSRLHVMNLRGHAADMTNLRPPIEQAIEKHDFSMIIFDPAYKLLGNRSENDAGEMADLMNEFEALAVQSGSAICFAHHFSKGNQAGKFSIDRMSGSGVLARDPDAILIMSDHEEEDCYVCEPTLRAFPALPGFGLRWDFPQLRPCADVDVEGIKQPGRNKAFSDKQILELLPSSGLTFGDWLEKAKNEYGIGKTSFYKLLKSLQDNDLVFKQDGGLWMPFGQFTIKKR
jgi:hypothetical protein